MKFRKKPVVIDAIQWNGAQDDKAVGDFIPGNLYCFSSDYHQGTMRVEHGDWIIKGVKGEFYPCKPDIFEAHYEKVEEPQ